MNIYEFIDNYYSQLEVVEIFPDEDDWDAIHDWYEAHNYEF